MALTGRTGADAIFKALKRICIVLTKYQSKLVAVIVSAQSAGAITSAQAADATALINLASAACVAFQRIADYSGF